MLKKIIGILLTMILIVSLLPLSAFAGGENGLVYHLTTDKSKYSKTEDITVTLTVTNKSSDGVSYAGVKLVNKVPAGYTLKKGSSLEKSVPVLAPGESAKLVSVFQPVYYPPTGDPGIGLTLLAGVIAVLCGLFLLSGKKGRYMNIFRSMMCLMMVLSLVTMILPQTAQAEPETIPVSVTVKVEGDEIKISSYITYEDTLPLTSSVFALDDGNGSAAVTADGKAVTVADAGTSLAFKAVPKDGYEFDYWEVADGGIDIGSVKNNASITVTMPGTVLALKAHFKAIAPETYAVTAAADENGTAAVTADGTAVSTAEEGTSLAFKAVPGDGYEFDYWEVVSGGIDIGSVKNNASITVTMPAAALSLKAHFKAIPPVTYAVTVAADENGAAAVRADGEEITAAAAGKDIVFSAVPDDYYEFDYWEVVSGSIDIGSVKNNASITVTMPAAALSLRAHFKAIAPVTYAVTVTADDNGTAAVKADGEEITAAAAGKDIVFSAVPDDYYEFDYWEVVSGGIDIGSVKNNASITVTMPAAALSLKAYFKAIPPVTYAVTAATDENGTAAVTADGTAVSTAEEGTSLAFKAVPKDGYEFDYWEVVSGGIDIGSVRNNASITVTMPATALSLKAYFKAIPPVTYAVTVTADDNGTAAVKADGEEITAAAAGKDIVFNAVPNNYYEFDYWEVVSGSIDIGSVKNNASITVTMPAAALSLKAHFKEGIGPYSSIHASTDYHGTAKVTANGEEIDIAGANMSVTFSAAPNDGYEFDYWEVNSGDIDIEAIKNNATITVKMTRGVLVLTAHFKVKTYAITLEDDGYGTAKAQVNSADADAAEAGAAVQLVATPEEGYQFKEWQVVDGGVTVSDNGFTMPSNAVTVKAVFERVYTITVTSQGNGTASASAAKSVAGREITLTATPDTGNEFKEWSVVSGTITITDDKFTMPAEDVSVQAVFEKQVTVANVLSMASTTFPASFSESNWLNDNNVAYKMFYEDGSLNVSTNVDGSVVTMAKSGNVLTKNATGYEYSVDGSHKVIFVMDGTTLSSIEIQGYSTDGYNGSYAEPACIAAGTMISMLDGKQKAVEELEIGDVICTFDHETGKVSSAPVVFVWETPNAGNAFTLTFEDGTAVTVIQEHGFYDQEEQQYAFINLQNAEEYIGHHFYNADSNSWLELKNCEVLNHSVDAYDIVTSGDFNHMANGLLAIGDGTERMFANLFAFDDQMKFDADKKKADIETYGLTPREKVLELEGFTESDYDTYNLQYLDILIGKGIVTWEQMEALSDYCVENGF